MQAGADRTYPDLDYAAGRKIPARIPCSQREIWFFNNVQNTWVGCWSYPTANRYFRIWCIYNILLPRSQLFATIIWARGLVWNTRLQQQNNKWWSGRLLNWLQYAIDKVIINKMNYICKKINHIGLATMNIDGNMCFESIVWNLDIIISWLYTISYRSCCLQGNTNLMCSSD